jgi:hypothetical protein
MRNSARTDPNTGSLVTAPAYEPLRLARSARSSWSSAARRSRSWGVSRLAILALYAPTHRIQKSLSAAGL